MKYCSVCGIRKKIWKQAAGPLGLWMALSLALTGCGQEQAAGMETWEGAIEGSEAHMGAAGERASDPGREEHHTDKETDQPEYAAEEPGGQAPQESEPSEEETVREYPLLTKVEYDRVKLVIESEGIYCILAGSHYGYIADTGELAAPFHYHGATPFSEGLACICLNGKYGYIDRSGETVLELKYDYATPFVEGLAYFALGDTYGFMDQSGEPVFYLDCDSVSSFQEGLAYFSIDGKYGYIDQTGTVVIEPVYDDADYFHNGVAKVRVGGRIGYIDAYGGEALPLGSYDSLSVEGDYILAETDGNTLCFGRDAEGEWSLLLKEKEIYPVPGAGRTLLKFMREGSNTDIDYCGLADSDGTILIQPIKGYLFPLADWELVMATRATPNYMIDEYGDKWTIWEDALLDLRGNQVVPYGEYLHIASSDSSIPGKLWVTAEDGEEGYLDLEDYSVEPLPDVYELVGAEKENSEFLDVYTSVSSYQRGPYASVRYGEKAGVIDREGNLVFPIQYTRAEVFPDGSVVLYDGEELRYSLYDSEQNLIFQHTGSTKFYPCGDGYRLGNSNGPCIYLNSEGERLIRGYLQSAYLATVQSNIRFYRTDDGYESVFAVVNTSAQGTPAIEVEGAILKNSITPRLGPFYEKFLERVNGSSQGAGTRMLFRLYRADGFEEPLLYFYEESFLHRGTDANISRFYQMQEGKAVMIIRGDDGGGSEGGEYVTLWYDRETDRVLPGLHGEYGGFRGQSTGGNVFEATDGVGAEETASFYEISQYADNYSQEELSETPELFYDYFDFDGEVGVRSFTADTIGEAWYIWEFEVNGERVSMERYQEVYRRYEELYSIWY